MKKYKLLQDNTKEVLGRTLYRIQALRDFGNVKKGNLGGYIEKEENLSHDSTCWISGEAKVYGGAMVSGKADVSGEAEVYGRAMVCGEAMVYGGAKVSGEAWVCGRAEVSGEAMVSGKAEVSGEAEVFGSAVATVPVTNLTGLRHNITITDTHIAIGCENHTIEYWEEHIHEIGAEHQYSEDGILYIKNILQNIIKFRGAYKCVT